MTDACDISLRPPAPDHNPPPDEIKNILSESKTIAIIGLSDKPGRASLDVGLYLKDHGYTVIPVHPKISDWRGIKTYSSLKDVPGPVDIVDIFRKANAIDGLVEEIVEKKPRVVWLQLGIVNNEAAVKIRKAGIVVVQDRCLKIEHSSLLGR
ncbi:MAG TPA: CoA-binding protein [Nitrospirae bacterium]|nr:CoA-binding protein [Nitrospirota bacterium]